jgi:hypothetical protein
MRRRNLARWVLWSALVAVVPGWSAPAPAAEHEFDRLSAPVKEMLVNASDRALDKLARPGAFTADQAIRIIIPGDPEKAATVMRMADAAGITARLQRSINDAAGLAAGQAKPIFRAAIMRMTLRDTVKILTHDHGATRYLKRSSGDRLRAMLHPIIADALERTGAMSKLAALQASGLLDKMKQHASEGGGEGAPPPEEALPPAEDFASADDPSAPLPPMPDERLTKATLIDSVTDQAMEAIFKYIARQEEKIRDDPTSLAFKLLERLDR